MYRMLMSVRYICSLHHDPAFTLVRDVAELDIALHYSVWHNARCFILLCIIPYPQLLIMVSFHFMITFMDFFPYAMSGCQQLFQPWIWLNGCGESFVGEQTCMWIFCARSLTIFAVGRKLVSVSTRSIYVITLICSTRVRFMSMFQFQIIFVTFIIFHRTL